MNKTALTAALLTTLTLSACGGGSAGAPPPGKDQPGSGPPPTQGSITGQVVNGQGQPLAGAEVIASNTLAYNSHLITNTDASGRYRIALPAVPLTWRVYASARLQYQGQTFKVDLLPQNDTTVAGPEGGVRNFSLSPKPLTADDPYGNLGIIEVETGIGEDGVDQSREQLTLTPLGPLADGTTGNTQTVQPILTGDGWIVPDVMYGTYRVTVTQDGQPMEIRRHSPGGAPDWADSYTGGFVNDYSPATPTMFIEVRLP